MQDGAAHRWNADVEGHTCPAGVTDVPFDNGRAGSVTPLHLRWTIPGRRRNAVLTLHERAARCLFALRYCASASRPTFT